MLYGKYRHKKLYGVFRHRKSQSWRTAHNLRHILIVPAAIILFFLIAVCLSGCKTTESVATAPIAPDTHSHLEDKARETYIHDTTYIDRWHTIRVAGDTVFVKDSTYHYDGKKEVIHDTISTNNTDTIHEPVIIEKPLTDKQVFLIKSGKILWGVAAALLIGLILAIFIRRR